MAPGTGSLTGDWVRGDDSKQNSYYTLYDPIWNYETINVISAIHYLAPAYMERLAIFHQLARERLPWTLWECAVTYRTMLQNGHLCIPVSFQACCPC